MFRKPLDRSRKLASFLITFYSTRKIENGSVSPRSSVALILVQPAYLSGTIYLRITAALSFKDACDNPTPRHEAAASTKKSLILAWRPGAQFCATSIAAANVGSAIVRSQPRRG
jgi:hypothetical protein